MKPYIFYEISLIAGAKAVEFRPISDLGRTPKMLRIWPHATVVFQYSIGDGEFISTVAGEDHHTWFDMSFERLRFKSATGAGVAVPRAVAW